MGDQLQALRNQQARQRRRPLNVHTAADKTLKGPRAGLYVRRMQARGYRTPAPACRA